jgi:uncharacterized protein involved in exopolysaccharide biosynthesis
MSKLQSEIHDDEIDLLELIKVLWDAKIRIVAITSVAAFISVIYGLTQPNIYHADALLAPAGDEGGGGMSGLAGQFGGLASLAGVSLPDEGVNKSELGLEVLKSRKFVREFVERHKIIPQLMAVDYWDPENRKLVLDTDVYDEKSKTWLSKEGPPTNQKVFETYLNNLILEEDPASEFVRLGFKHKSPDIAAKWTGLIVKDLNDALRMQDISEAESSIAYLRKQIETSPLTELRNLFYNLIQSQTETMMLANVREEYVFKTIDPAIVPEKKSEPKRALICILGTFLGGFLALIYVLGRHYIRPLNS